MNKELSFKNIVGIWLLAIVFLVLHGITISFGTFDRENIFIYLTFFINGALWLFLLVKELWERPYSMKIIFYTFSLFFFYFAGLIQYIAGRFPWIVYRDNETVLKANCLLFLFTVSYEFGSQIVSEMKLNTKGLVLKEFNITNARLVIITLISLAVFINKVRMVGFAGLFSRLTVRGTVEYSESSAITMLVKQLLMALQSIAALVTLMAAKKNYKKSIFFIICLGCLACTYPPGMISRYAVATIYGSIFILMFDSFKKNRVFILFFVLAYTILFPFLNNFRHADYADVDTIKALSNTLEGIKTGWLAGDYDAYATFSLTFDSVKAAGATMGRQLLGVFFFFVPRDMWPNKPIGSGAYMGQSLGWTFTNVSCPLPGEAYINFGTFGIILFGAGFGFLSKIMDKFYWEKKSTVNTKFDILYAISLMMFFFMLRGDLLSSWAYLIAYISVWVLFTFNIPESLLKKG
ncbi:MAG: oligosaccharide repeat unit polymerase [Ruminococcus sp.]|uniref:O-antigen polymerase n=1 Tax=Ruminococcus sp. TaxID=41978 RepID=UPI0025F2776E|nr:O-antigen polymerase [Ruminococcus sp.]MBR5681846.1 oligosaccharide repeat unit polymerase [Ruminococcus sp.]